MKLFSQINQNLVNVIITFNFQLYHLLIQEELAFMQASESVVFVDLGDRVKNHHMPMSMQVSLVH